MGGTLLFIHGTGVRQAGYYETMHKLAKGLQQAGRPDITVAGFPWGDTLGTQIDAATLDTILPPAAAKAIGDDDEQWEAALWEQLLQDPLFELRMAAIREETSEDPLAAALPGQTALAEEAVIARVMELPAKLHDPLPGGVGAAVLAQAAETIGQSCTLVEAANAAPDADDDDLNQAIARAIVATALADARGEFGTGPDALYVIEQRRQLVRHIAQLLMPATKGFLSGWLSNKIQDAAKAWATGYGKKRRETLVAGAGPGVGDILLYQRRGAAILDAIEAEIIRLDAAGGPVIALGHSLGGIMLVDLLSRPRAAGPLPVAKLITVGSQSPAFFKCDALDTMRPGAPLPPGTPFTPWLNIYDRNDFLSFCAKTCFPGVTAGIEDFEVSSGVSFPDAHSAYFRLDAVFAKIAAHWP
jgi:hypothetical protein